MGFPNLPSASHTERSWKYKHSFCHIGPPDWKGLPGLSKTEEEVPTGVCSLTVKGICKDASKYFPTMEVSSKPKSSAWQREYLPRAIYAPGLWDSWGIKVRSRTGTLVLLYEGIRKTHTEQIFCISKLKYYQKWKNKKNITGGSKRARSDWGCWAWAQPRASSALERPQIWSLVPQPINQTGLDLRVTILRRKWVETSAEVVGHPEPKGRTLQHRGQRSGLRKEFPGGEEEAQQAGKWSQSLGLRKTRPGAKVPALSLLLV